MWVRLDAGGDWLADMSVLQPETMWAEQLESSKDVAAQVRLNPEGISVAALVQVNLKGVKWRHMVDETLRVLMHYT